MATLTVSVDSTTYVLVSASDGLLQNASLQPMRLIFDVSLPAVDASNYHPIQPQDAVLITAGVPAGNAYMRAENDGVTLRASFSG